MKVFITMLILLFNVLFANAATETLVKFYMNDGSAAEVINIKDINKMAIKKLSNNFSMTVYYKIDSNAVYQTSEIDTLKFVNNANNQKQLNVYLSGSTKSFLVSEIDSIIFKENVDDTETVTIGNQVWTKKNLDVSHYRNGDTIPEVRDAATWANLKTGAWCYYNNDPANGAIYGKLYNWYAVNDSRGLAPGGYHVPSDAEWTVLSTYLGGESVAGGKMKETGTTHWYIPNTGATNSSGFSGLPGGYRLNNGGYYYIRSFGIWWSSTEYGGTLAWYRYLYFDYINIVRSYVAKGYGISVRCVRD